MSPAVKAALAACAVLAAGLAGHVAGGPAADRERESTDLTAVQRVVEGAEDGEQARALLCELRTRLGRHPLDARTRTTYAVVLLAVAGSPRAAEAAAFHASRSAALAPVTVPVNRRAALVLASAGRPDDALAVVRTMFSYDAESAARVLSAVRPLVPQPAEDGVPEDPDARLAWISELRRIGERDHAARLLAESVERWPRHLPTVRDRASSLVAGQRWDELEALIERARIPEHEDDPHLVAYRARLSAARGDVDATHRDAERAVARASRDPGVLLIVGDALEAVGDFAGAKSAFQRAAYRMPRSAPANKRAVPVVRLARLAERTRHGGEALRRWRDVLEIEPDCAEAVRRIEELTAATP